MQVARIALCPMDRFRFTTAGALVISCSLDAPLMMFNVAQLSGVISPILRCLRFEPDNLAPLTATVSLSHCRKTSGQEGQ